MNDMNLKPQGHTSETRLAPRLHFKMGGEVLHMVGQVNSKKTSRAQGDQNVPIYGSPRQQRHPLCA